jgi:hypothetical protein
MASVRLHCTEVKEGSLPLVCAKCGEPAESTVRKKFSWCPPWVLATILIGLLVWVVLSIIMTKRMTVAVPLCERHKNHWSWRTWTILLTLVAGVALCIAIPVTLSSLNPRGRDETLSTLAWAVPVGIGLVWLIAAAMISSSAIQAGEITDQSIKITNVCAAFRDAVDQFRSTGREKPVILERWNSRKKDQDRQDDDRITRT